MNVKLYKFRTPDTYNLSALANNYLWFSKIEDFNDPFEGIHGLNGLIDCDLMAQLVKDIVWKKKAEVGEDKFNKMLSDLGLTEGFTPEQKIQAVIEHDFQVLIKTIKSSMVLSMSVCNEIADPVYENLIWSHYADGLRGFCLVFDGDELLTDLNSTEASSVKPIDINYQAKPISLNLRDFVTSGVLFGEEDYEFVNKTSEIIATKSKAWSYENEIRFLSLNKENKHSYSPATLKEIIIGAKMPPEQETLVISIAKAANPNIKIKKATLKKNSFELEIK